MGMMEDLQASMAIVAASAVEGSPAKVFRMGTIDSAYSSGRPRVLFDGETSLSGITQTYPYLASYTPVASNRVLLARVGGTYVILGRIV